MRYGRMQRGKKTALATSLCLLQFCIELHANDFQSWLVILRTSMLCPKSRSFLLKPDWFGPSKSTPGRRAGQLSLWASCSSLQISELRVVYHELTYTADLILFVLSRVGRARVFLLYYIGRCRSCCHGRRGKNTLKRFSCGVPFC